MQFRFTFDPNGTPTVVENPLGWEEAKINIERDEVLNGVFKEYTTSLTFHSDGYDFLNALIEVNICSIVDVLIEQRCEPTDVFETLFEGQIFLFDATEINTQMCTIAVNIESITLDTIFLRNVDVETRIPIGGGFTESLNGVVIPNASLGAVGALVKFNGVFGAGVNAWTIFSVLEFIIDYIMDGELTFSSNFFDGSAIGRTNNWDIAIGSSGTIGAGDVITTTYDNFYGETNVIATPFTVDPATTIAKHADDLLFQTASINISEDLGNWDTRTWATSNVVGSTISLVSWIPFTITSTVIAGGPYAGVVTVTETQVYRRGPEDPLSESKIGNGYGFVGSVSGGGTVGDHLGASISFTKIYDEMNKLYNIGLRIFDNAGVPTIEIEKLEDLFTATAVVTLDNVPDLKFTFFKKNLPSTIIVGDTSDTELKTDLNNPLSWSTNVCGDEVLNLTNSILFDNGALNDLMTNNNVQLNENLFYIDDVDTTGSGAIFEWHLFDIGLGAKRIQKVHNRINQNINKLEAHLFSLGVDTLLKKDLVITNNSTLKLKREYTFVNPLTLTEFKTIESDPLKPIAFSQTDADHKDGWIKTLEYDVQTGETDLTLLAE